MSTVTTALTILKQKGVPRETRGTCTLKTQVDPDVMRLIYANRQAEAKAPLTRVALDATQARIAEIKALLAANHGTGTCSAQAAKPE